jgi:prolyl oligopeptidase PreP (S9A serine peptidase family)
MMLDAFEARREMATCRPAYLVRLQPVLRRGVCFVTVNLRGGGELG